MARLLYNQLLVKAEIPTEGSARIYSYQCW